MPNFGTLTGTQADIYQLDVLDLYKQYDEESLKQFNDMINDYVKGL